MTAASAHWLKRAWPSLAFLLIVPLAAHWRYSGLGFNPTDDGFILAYSRRLLEGQIPHRDFIAIRPVGSALLHLPFLLFCGEHLLLISRLFVWLQLAAIALAWTHITGKLLGAKTDAPATIAIALITFALSAHTFPIMAWHTVDGLFLASSGLLLCLQAKSRWRVIGFALLGMSALCKQNFAVLAPAAIFLLGDRKHLSAWAAAAMPGLLYAAMLVLTGGIADAVLQLSTQTDLQRAGFEVFLWQPATAWGMLFGFVAVRLLHPAGAEGLAWTSYAAASLAIFSTLIAASYAMTQGQYLWAPAFGLFGMAAGASVAHASGREAAGPVVAGALTTLMIWCAALSVGYNTPAIASGLAAALLLNSLRAAPTTGAWARSPLPLLLLAGVVLFNFDAARQKFVYLDRPAAELVVPLGPLLAGGAGIRTGPNTAAFLADLHTAVSQVPDGKYAIVPNLAAWWLQARQPNPLPIDWPQWIELGRPALLDRVTGEMERQRGLMTIIVEKVQAGNLSRGFVPLADSDRFAAARYARQHFSKIAETQFFELYR